MIKTFYKIWVQGLISWIPNLVARIHQRSKKELSYKKS